jgi:hypothetical protein
MTPAQKAVIARAKVDLVTFAALVLRDEQTGAPITLAPFQKGILRALESESRVIVRAPPESGKSNLAAAALAFALGRNPALRCLLVSGTVQQSARLLRLVAIIISSPVFQQVFPGCTLARTTHDELWLSNRPPTAKDASVTAGAYALSSMLGQRVDYLLGDDIVSRESLLTPESRQRAQTDFVAISGSRLAPGGRLHVVNAVEHADDLPARLGKLPGWKTLSFPILDEVTGQSLWPERWSLDRIAARRAELGERRFQTTMQCNPAPEGSAAFAESDINRALANGLSLQHNDIPDGKAIVAVDPAWTTRSTSDLSAIVMIVVERGPRSSWYHLTHVETLKIPAEQLVNRVIALCQMSKARAVVESNAAGSVIAEQIAKRVPCKGLPTTLKSKEFRVQSLSNSLAAGRWVFRCPTGSASPELRRLVTGLVCFAWDAHTPDDVSALLVGVEAIHEIESRPVGRVLNTFVRPGGGIGIVR